MHRLAATLLLTLAACAPTGQTRMAGSDILGAPAPRQCFLPQQIINFRQGETQQLYIKVLGGDVYQVSSGGCLELDFTNALSLQPDLGPSDRLCVGDSARLVVRSSSSTAPCRARVDRKLTGEEVAALPSRQRP